MDRENVATTSRLLHVSDFSAKRRTASFLLTAVGKRRSNWGLHHCSQAITPWERLSCTLWGRLTSCHGAICIPPVFGLALHRHTQEAKKETAHPGEVVWVFPPDSKRGSAL